MRAARHRGGRTAPHIRRPLAARQALQAKHGDGLDQDSSDSEVELVSAAEQRPVIPAANPATAAQLQPASIPQMEQRHDHSAAITELSLQFTRGHQNTIHIAKSSLSEHSEV